jgi:hypothetical protein
MKGIVFTAFAELVENTWGEDMMDDILSDADLSGAYTSVGTYPHTQLVDLVVALSARVGVPEGELVRLFGHHLMGLLHQAHKDFFTRVDSLPAFLSSVETHIHDEVRKLYADATPPHVTVTHDDQTIRMLYTSHRPFADLAQGLLEASLERFPGKWSIVREPASEQGTVFVIRRF